MPTPLVNPVLKYGQKVILKDGREGRIADKAEHLKSRAIDIIGEQEMKIYKIKEIEFCFVGNSQWIVNWQK
jgi:predicted DNA-binding antitoxin AbrB/MazE fold protein